MEIVTDVLDINVEGLVPNGGLASAILDIGLELLLARRDLDVGVHLADEIRVAGELSLNKSDSELSKGHV